MTRRPRARQPRAAIPERLAPPTSPRRHRPGAPPRVITGGQWMRALAREDARHAAHVYPPSTSRVATWPCRSAACGGPRGYRWTRPSRSHDGASCDACGAGRAKDAAKDATPIDRALAPG